MPQYHSDCRRPYWRGWTPIIVLPALTIVFAEREAWPRWGLMWALAFAIYVGCKWLTWREARVVGLPWWIHAGYLFGWPGLDASSFLKTPDFDRVDKPTHWEWFAAGFKTLIGICIFIVAGLFIPPNHELMMGWLGMIGAILVLHFGTFHLLSCTWRLIGINAQALMNKPIRSKSIGEFWARRWNTAFRDLTHRFLFRPLTSTLGIHGAFVAGFFFSGLLHDLVISVPSGGGYGWPTLYFLLQFPTILAERSTFGRRIGLGKGWLGRAFTFVALIAPIGLLFHPPFVRNVVAPFMRVAVNL